MTYAERVMDGNINVPGYEFGSPSVPRSPVSLEELRALEQACGFDNNAREQLRKAAGQLTRRAEDLVDKWRSVIGEHAEMRQVRSRRSTQRSLQGCREKAFRSMGD